MTKPYQAAVLLDRSFAGGISSSDGEVAAFLQEEWSTVVQTKGAHRLKHLRDENSVARSSGRGGGMSQLLGFVTQPSVLLFFHSTTDIQDTTNVKKLMSAAKESISLDGLDKADLKDMLMTLLP